MPTVYNVTGGGAYCSGGSGLTVGLSNSQSGVNYQLIRNGTNVGSPVAGTGSALDFGLQTAAGTYTVSASNGSCSSTMNGNAVITVTPLPNTTFTYSSYTYCATGASPAATLSGSPQTGTFSASPAGLNFSNANTGVINLATSTPGTYAITYTIAASGGCAVYTYTQPTSVVINAVPTAYTVSGTGTYCVTTGGDVTLGNSETGVDYQLIRDGTNVGSTIPGTGSALDFGLQTTAGTYTVSASNGNCSTTMNGSAVITITPVPNTTFTYSSSTYCATGTSPAATLSGSPQTGTFSASPAGLNFSNAGTGVINLATSTPGTYSIVYTVAASGGCASYTSPSVDVTVIAAPVATIDYSASPYCTTSGTATVTQTGQAGGTYSASPSGLSLNASTGDVDLSASSAGTYTVTYTFTNGTCSNTATAQITVTAAPSATIAYNGGSPICTSSGAVNVTRTGTAGGAYSASPSGLTIDASTGAITPSGSTAGTYTVTYTVAASGGCALYTTTTTVTITALPTATISYSGSPYCTTSGTATVTQTGQAGGTYSSTAGLSINSTTGDVNLSASTPGSYTVSYTIAAAGGCAAVIVTTPITVTAPPSATIAYNGGSPICNSSGTVNVTRTGTAGGTYSASPSGLTISSPSGAITPTSSTAGTYTVTYTVAASGGCALYTTTTTVTITALPTATISYGGSPYCTTSGTATVTQTGQSGGTYSSTAGLSINSTTGDVNLSASTPGTYTVSYTIAAAGGCAAVVKTTNITITAAPSATIAYNGGSPICTSSGAVNVTRTGTAGGTYSASPSGLTISSSSGAITPSGSTAGTYTVTYTIAASGGCALYTTTTTVTITALPTATISYSGSPYCTTSGTATVTQTGQSGGTYSSTAGLSINSTTGDVNLSASTPGTYTVSYTIAAAGGCAAVVKTTNITVTAPPSATIAYNGGSPICTSSGTVSVTRTGTSGGTYSASPSGLSIGSSSGTITPSTSTAGTYTVTYSVAASGGCALYTTTTTVTITALPTASISYAGTPYCSTSGTATVTQTGQGGGTYSSTGGLSINSTTGAVDLSASTPGTYTVSYTIAAAGGCAAVVKTTSIRITAAPSATISYSASSFCSNSGTVTVTRTGTSGGTYTASPGGLSISSSSGTITPSTSSPGNYTVTYTIAASGGCSTFTTTTPVTINATPSTTNVSGAGMFCGSTTITASGGSGGTIYFQGTTSNGTSTADASSSEVVTASGTYYFRSMSAAGCWGPQGSVDVTINPLPSGSFTASNTTICSGQSVTFTAPTGSNYAYTFYVNGTGVQGPDNSNTYSSSTLANGDQVTVDIANSFNCGTTLGPITMTVNTLPAPTISASTTSICPGESVTFTAGGGSAGATYIFTKNGNPIQSGTSNTYTSTTLQNNDAVSVKITDVNSCTSASATPVVMTVNPLPTGTLTPASVTICDGDNVTLTATPGYSSYEFKVNSSTVQGPNGTNTFSSTTLANASIVTVLVTSTAGCSATFNSVPVTVNTIPNVTVTLTETSGTPNDGSICSGSNVKFTATPGFTNYIFYLRGTNTVLQNSSSNIYQSTAMTDGDYVSVVATSNKGCSNTATPAISGTITVVPSPSGTLTVSPANTICAGTSVTFTATAGAGNNYAFKVGSTVVQNGTGNTYTTTSLSNGNVVSVVVTNPATCSATYNSITMTVNPLPSGNLQISETSGTADDGIICTGTPVTFTAPNGFSNYNFLLNGATIQNGGSRTYSTSTLANGDKVTVAVTNASGCIGLLNEWDITVNPLPVVAAISGVTPVCVGSTITLSDADAGGTWSSDDDSKATVDATTGEVTGVSAGNVQINYTYTNGNGCSSTVSAMITVKPLPSVDPITGNFNICIGIDVTLSDATYRRCMEQ